MKKLFVCLCAGVLLAGCGGGSAEKEKVTKTCTMEQSGMGMTLNFDAEGDTVTGAEMIVSANYEAFGATKETFDALTEDQKKQITDEIIKQASESEDMEGIDVKSSFDDEGMKITMTYEVGALEKTLNATSVDEMTKEAEGMGMTCK